MPVCAFDSGKIIEGAFLIHSRTRWLVKSRMILKNSMQREWQVTTCILCKIMDESYRDV